MKMRLPAAVIAALMITGSSVGVKAQDGHEGHHPAETPAQAAAPTTPPPTPNAAAMQADGGMMGNGMMGGDMMSMMSMMSRMMGRGPVGMSGMAMPGMDMADRVEGRLAFLRTELKIADTQTKVWNDFATALRDNARKLSDLRAAAQGAATASQPLVQLEQQERWYSARLDGIRAIKTALQPLYASLSPEQKQSADQLLGPHLGLMPMAMMSMGMSAAGAQGGMPMGGMTMPGARP